MKFLKKENDQREAWKLLTSGLIFEAIEHVPQKGFVDIESHRHTKRWVASVKNVTLKNSIGKSI